MLQYLKILADARRSKMDEKGASAVEYGLLVAGVAAAVLVVVALLNGIFTNAFDNITAVIDGD